MTEFNASSSKNIGYGVQNGSPIENIPPTANGKLSFSIVDKSNCFVLAAFNPEIKASNLKKSRFNLSDVSNDDALTKVPEKSNVIKSVFGKSYTNEEVSEKESVTKNGSFCIAEENDEFKWDFDRVMAKKKQERAKKRRPKKNDSFDLCSNADSYVNNIVKLMQSAASEDREANEQRQPALQKMKMLETVKSTLIRADLTEVLLESNMMGAVAEWLALLPDKSLPSLAIRTDLLTILSRLPIIESDVLKTSGLGKAVMLIFKHPKETVQNKLVANKLIRDWSRPIFQKNRNYSTVSREDRAAFDFEQMTESKRRKLDSIQRVESSSSSNALRCKVIPFVESGLGPGDPGFVDRARVPQVSTSVYINRPKSKIDENFQEPAKSKASSSFKKTAREFKKRAGNKNIGQSTSVSTEGQHMK